MIFQKPFSCFKKLIFSLFNFSNKLLCGNTMIHETKHSLHFKMSCRTNRFWKTYITFIFVIYVILIGFILFIITFSELFTLGKLTYGIVLNVNGSIFIAITYYEGRIVITHETFSRHYTSF